jgi:hypothetical protein
MGVKEYVKDKWESYKKEQQEEKAYRKELDAEIKEARRKAYAEESVRANANAARMKARTDVSGRGSGGGFFSTIVKNKSNAFSGINLPQGGGVMGNNPMFGVSAPVRRRAKSRPQPKRYYYVPIRPKIKRPKMKRVYYPARKSHRKAARSKSYGSGLGIGSLGWGV